MNEFFQRLKQRKLVQWTLAYVAAAFALLQGVDIVAQRFGWPEQTMRFVIIALSVGLFVALVVAWYHGERGAQRVTGTELLILALLLAVGGGLLWRFVSIARGPTEQSGAARASVESKSEVNAKSVAVLAFANLSDDKGSEYFSDGISEELLTVLQKIPGLHVAARTSAFSFKGKNATAQEIGEKLGVAHLVEGSVRKSGDSVRIAARLTRTDTGEQLWSENFTRDLKDVFAVQTELAQTIVGQLSGQLTNDAADPAAKAAIQAQVQAAERGGTKNVEAHEHYLQGRFYSDRGSEKSAGEALVEYQRAVELDPSFALAWAGLARTHMWYCGLSDAIRRAGFDDHLALADAAVKAALRLRPDSAEAHFARGDYYFRCLRDYDRAQEELAIARPGLPNSTPFFILSGYINRRRNHFSDAERDFSTAFAPDPRNPNAYNLLADTYVLQRRFPEAVHVYDNVLAA